MQGHAHADIGQGINHPSVYGTMQIQHFLSDFQETISDAVSEPVYPNPEHFSIGTPPLNNLF